MNKKGLMYTVLICLVIASIIAFIIFASGSKWFKLFMKNPDEQINENSFDMLANTINKLNNGQIKYEEVIFSLTEDAVIIGFNKVWDDNKYVEKCSGDDKVAKPKACEDMACLCQYVEGTVTEFKNEKCVKFPDIDYIISAPFYDYNYQNFGMKKEVYDQIQYAFEGYPVDGLSDKFINKETSEEFKFNFGYLFIYADCKWKLGIINLYIDKFTTTEGKTGIFISPVCDYTQQRKNEIKEKSGIV